MSISLNGLLLSDAHRTSVEKMTFRCIDDSARHVSQETSFDINTIRSQFLKVAQASIDDFRGTISGLEISVRHAISKAAAEMLDTKDNQKKYATNAASAPDTNNYNVNFFPGMNGGTRVIRSTKPQS